MGGRREGTGEGAWGRRALILGAAAEQERRAAAAAAAAAAAVGGGGIAVGDKSRSAEGISVIASEVARTAGSPSPFAATQPSGLRDHNAREASASALLSRPSLAGWRRRQQQSSSSSSSSVQHRTASSLPALLSHHRGGRAPRQAPARRVQMEASRHRERRPG
ncbi:hypothetical protein CERZMDRAFT_81352 [Cercospora zeae-maydis SCOH1-5]|uniref:Uncharacterized protein n=1 Tax=Cercospora zeae-maydis SCOH1-5 TaxID=717836 RepID=A0A6A6FS31_9PEZI|nr:hypothetical protein CERZMDRAFT_81352 [Cercospora zeae-maydis SCOH1-5]